jgi:hypothetical protein
VIVIRDQCKHPIFVIMHLAWISNFKSFKMKLIFVLLSLFYLVFVMELGLKAQSSTKTYTNQLSGKKIINISTGENLKEENLGEFFSKYPNAILEPNIDKYGEIVSYEIDPSKTNKILTRDETKRTANGAQFLPFVMKTIDKKTLNSERLIGQPILIIFQVSLNKPFFIESKFKEVASIASDYASTKSLETIMLTEDSEDKIGAFNAQGFKIVTDGRNFSQRYLITDIPTVVLIDKEGKLVSYYSSNNFNKLKEDLNLLK